MTETRANFDNYIDTFRAVAERENVNWNVTCLDDGKIVKDQRWSLNDMLGVPAPPSFWLNNLGNDKTSLMMKLGSEVEPLILHPDWQELIKASTLEHCYIKKSSLSYINSGIIRPLRCLGTLIDNKAPWELTPSDAENALNILLKVQKSGKLEACARGILINLFDTHKFSPYGPLVAKRNYRQLKKVITSDVRKTLESRTNSKKLPEAEAFWELVRIVFTETPNTFLDCLRFEMAKLMILLGLRGNEIATLPYDCIRYREYFDKDGNTADKSGGIARSLQLRHFAEKQKLSDQDGILLYENTVDVPPQFEEAVLESVRRVQDLTIPLRERLKRQVETKRIFPEFDENEIISIVDLYTRLNGVPFVFEDPKRDELIAKYKLDHSRSVLEAISDRQKVLFHDGDIINKVRQYFGRAQPPKPKIPLRFLDLGDEMPRLDFYQAGIRISELEEWLHAYSQTKLSDTGAFRITSSTTLEAYECLFIGPKRALAEERNDGICDVLQYAFVGRLTLSDVDISLSGASKHTPTLFAKYGETEEDKKLTINTHDFRHLINTELFRVGVADTVITKRFNRKSVAQSYEYDHRSLAEDLENVEIPAEHDTLLYGNARQVFKMIKAGKGRGPIADQFLKIQSEEGDEAAIVYLAAEADGFHLTPYGACLNSFVAEPCPKHLECFNGCIHLHRTGNAKETEMLEKLKTRYGTLLDGLDQHPGSEAAKANARNHALERLNSIERILDAENGDHIFPDGQDLSHSGPSEFKGPFSNE